MLRYFSTYYYIVPVQFILNLLFVIACSLNYNRIGNFKILLIYGLTALTQSIFATYIGVYMVSGQEKIKLIQNSINIFMLIEFILFNLFLIKSTSISSLRKILIGTSILFILVVLRYWFYTNAFNKSPFFLSVIESYLIIIGCLLYYYSNFTSADNIKIKDNPPFWIVTGMLFLFGCLLPVFLQWNNTYLQSLDIYNAVYLINFVGYIILFTFFILGLKCQIKK